LEYGIRNTTFEFKLGHGTVIQGWDIGLSNMCIKEIRKLIIPSDLAYGGEGAPTKIYPGATLVFEIELLGIRFNTKEGEYGGGGLEIDDDDDDDDDASENITN
jgi:FKBP-type peptidyl-prolyl cis-trans isomerase 2